MPSNKDRLYISLYARGGQPTMPGLEDKYHWAFLVGPKKETEGSQGRRYHAKEFLKPAANASQQPYEWAYESRDVRMAPSVMQLIRVMVAKVEDVLRLESILSGVPVRPEVAGWNCVSWVQEALDAALQDSKALGTSVKDWQSVRDTIMWYVESKKAAGRFEGSSATNPYLGQVATWDMLSGRELIP